MGNRKILLLSSICCIFLFCIMSASQPATAQSSLRDPEDYDRIISELVLGSFDIGIVRDALDSTMENGKTYGEFILAVLDEADFVYYIYTQEYKHEYTELFEKVLDSYTNMGSSMGELGLKLMLQAGARYVGPYAGSAVSSYVAALDAFEASLGLFLLAKLQYYDSYHWYLTIRSIPGNDHTQVWNNFAVPILRAAGIDDEDLPKYEQRFRSLWDNWHEYLTYGKIEQARLGVREELRDIVLSKLSDFLPKAFFTAHPTDGLPPLSVNFDATGSQPSEYEGAAITSYHWYIKDSQSNIVWERSPGLVKYDDIRFRFDNDCDVPLPVPMMGNTEYEVTLVVEDSFGGTDIASRTIWVKNPLQARLKMWDDPARSIEYMPDLSPKTIYFDASDSFMHSGYGIIEGYFWDFGDGNIGEGQFASHTYKEDGFYNVTLTVIGGNYTSRIQGLVRLGQSVQMVHVYGTIQEDARWTGYFYYIVHDSINLAQGATLAISPGTLVMFDGANSGLNVQGTLIANGTSELPITFTSNKASPQKGDWGGITFADTSTGNILDHVRVSYASYSVTVTSSDLTLINSTIRDNSTAAVYLTESTATISGNVISNNGDNTSEHGIILSSSSPEITNNTISNNAGCGICSYGDSHPVIQGNTISSNGSWSMQLNPYSDAEVSGNTITDSKGIYLNPGIID
ncbi:right-handed parallel beta-helix repeat-containing protein, partial [Candidatus Poribacteria bacterium]